MDKNYIPKKPSKEEGLKMIFTIKPVKYRAINKLLEKSEDERNEAYDNLIIRARHAKIEEDLIAEFTNDLNESIEIKFMEDGETF